MSVSQSVCLICLLSVSNVPGGLWQLAASDARTVRLRSVYLSTSGQFRCEVSLEAPSFDTFYDFGDMIVVGKCFENETTKF